jgi:hypothetical protein
MRIDRFAQAVGAGQATLWLIVLVILDVAIDGSTVVLSPLFALAPLIACAVLPVRSTAVIAAATVTAAVVSGFWDGTWGRGQHTVRIIDVLLISGAAVVVAWVRVRREQRLARVEAIAVVAQRTVLPTLPARVGQVSLGARYQSAARDALVGGDLFDCYHSEGRVRLLVGDVRGKGVGAVEQAARVIRAFRQAAGTRATLQALAEDMSAYLAPFFDDEEFVTAVLVDVSDPAEVTVVSCGHPPALLVRSDGRTSLLDAPAGLPLGLGDTYEAFTVPWDRGDRLLMYTDGLSEARDVDGEFPELHSLAPLVSAGTVDAALDAVLDAVRRHVASGRLGDDLAVMLLENCAVPAPAEPGTEQADSDLPVAPDPALLQQLDRDRAGPRAHLVEGLARLGDEQGAEGVVDGEDLGQACGLEHPQQHVARRDEPQRSAGSVDPLQPADQDPQPRGVDERHTGQVHHDLRSVGLEALG